MNITNKSIEKVLSAISKLNNKDKEFLEAYFQDAPIWLLQEFTIINIDKNTVFIREGYEIENIYILLEGFVRAVDYKIAESVYEYMWFDPVKTFGSMELLFDIEFFKTTLVTVTPCKMMVISRKIFEKWLKSDIKALSLEIKIIGNYLLSQAAKDRAFIQMSGNDRLLFLLKQLYEQSGSQDVCTVSLTRQELSDCTGLCVKTINRCVKKIEENNFISRQGNKIVISKKQYLNIENYISEKVAK